MLTVFKGEKKDVGCVVACVRQWSSSLTLPTVFLSLLRLLTLHSLFHHPHWWTDDDDLSARKSGSFCCIALKKGIAWKYSFGLVRFGMSRHCAKGAWKHSVRVVVASGWVKGVFRFRWTWVSLYTKRTCCCSTGSYIVPLLSPDRIRVIIGTIM